MNVVAGLFCCCRYWFSVVILLALCFILLLGYYCKYHSLHLPQTLSFLLSSLTSPSLSLVPHSSLSSPATHVLTLVTEWPSVMTLLFTSHLPTLTPCLRSLRSLYPITLSLFHHHPPPPPSLCFTSPLSPHPNDLYTPITNTSPWFNDCDTCTGKDM